MVKKGKTDVAVKKVPKKVSAKKKTDNSKSDKKVKKHKNKLGREKFRVNLSS
jgi:hypothetical protein